MSGPGPFDRDRRIQRCLNALCFSAVAALALAIAHQPRLSLAASAAAVIACCLLALSVRSARR